MSLPAALALAVAAMGVVWAGSAMLDTSAERLARRYRLPGVVQGAVIAAVGSSIPELSTAVLATWLHGEFELGLAAIIGSAVFNILVIPALAGVPGGRLRFDLNLVYKDAQFYLISIAVLLLALCLAIIYHPLPGELRGELTRPLALVPLGFYGLYLFLQQQDSAERPGAPPDGPLPPVSRDWLALVGSLVLIVAGVEGLVRAVLALGHLLGVPSFFWGATVVAAATSVPDALVSIRAARRRDAEVSLSNVLGSNIFDLLVAVPAGVLVAGSARVDLAVAAPMMAFLMLATIGLFSAMRVGLSLGPKECRCLLLGYAVFAVWMGLEGTGVLSLTSP